MNYTVFKSLKDELINGLLDIFNENIVKIILYGSVARNENTAESDIDIAIIISNPISDDVKKSFIDWNASMDLKYDCVLSIVDIEKDLFETWKDILPFYKNVSDEGIVLWSAA